MPRDNNSEITEVILQAALDVVCEHHISGTTTRKIAAQAGVSPALVHYYFPTKRDVFMALVDYLIDFYSKNHASWVYNSAMKPHEKLMIMVSKQVEYITRRKEYFVIFDFWVHAVNDPELREKVKEMFDDWAHWNRLIVDEGIESGDFDPANAHVIPNLLISLISGAAIQYLLNDQVFDLHAHFDEIYRLLIRMLGSPDAPVTNRAGRTIP